MFCGFKINFTAVSLLASCHIHSVLTSAVLDFILTVSPSLTACMIQSSSLFINSHFLNQNPLYISAGVEYEFSSPVSNLCPATSLTAAAVINSASLGLLAAAC